MGADGSLGIACISQKESRKPDRWTTDGMKVKNRPLPTSGGCGTNASYIGYCATAAQLGSEAKKTSLAVWAAFCPVQER